MASMYILGSLFGATLVEHFRLLVGDSEGMRMIKICDSTIRTQRPIQLTGRDGYNLPPMQDQYMEGSARTWFLINFILGE